MEGEELLEWASHQRQEAPEGNDALIPKARRQEIGEFITLLSWIGGEGWVTTKTILEKKPQWDARKLRILAEFSNGQIISGHRGYKLTCRASLQEKRQFLLRQRSQISKMQRRIDEVSRFVPVDWETLTEDEDLE